MWSNILGVNSFILWPAAFVFVVYTAGRAVVTLHWKMLVVALIIFALITIAEFVIAVIAES